MTEEISLLPKEPEPEQEKPGFLIFLDIDGVLRPNIPYDGKLKARCVEALREISTSLRAHIVISSTWRDLFTPRQFEKMLKLPVIGRCGDIGPAEGDRHREVLEYLRANNFEDVPWIAIDDTESHFKKNAPLYVPIDPMTGLTQDDVKKCLQVDFLDLYEQRLRNPR